MIEKKALYYCKRCGNVVESLWNGQPDIHCCGTVMEKLEENSVDAATEKHVPVIVRESQKVVVKVGEVAHPMTAEHYILFVELVYGNTVLRHDFVEGDTVAEATFLVDESVQELQARAYCNLHGFWVSK